MDMLKIVGVALVGTVLSLLIREREPALALSVGIVTAAVIFLMLLTQIEYVVEIIRMTASGLTLNEAYFAAILRMTAIAYLAQLGGELCRDAGQNAIATKVELAGKILIIAQSIPILLALMNLLIGLLP